MFAYLILNIQTIFKVVLGTFGYLVVFLFFFTSARDVEHKGHCWFIFIFSTKIKFNDFIEFFLDKFECIYDVYTIYTNFVVSHGCETCDTFILYFSWIVHSFFNNRKYLWLDKEYSVYFFCFCLQKVSVKNVFCIF